MSAYLDEPPAAPPDAEETGPMELTIRFDGWSGGSLAEQATALVANRIEKEVGKLLRERVAAMVDDLIRAKAEAALAEYLTAPIQPTNEYGQPKGQPKTITELVMERFETHMKERVDRDGRAGPYGQSRDKTRFDWIVQTITTEKLEQQVKDAVQQARTKGEQAMKAAIAEMLSKHLPKAGTS